MTRGDDISAAALQKKSSKPRDLDGGERNGVPLLRNRDHFETVTLELVNRLRDGE